MNSNLFHNIVNILTLLIGLVTAVLVTTGCIEGADGSLSCEASMVDPSLLAWIIPILLILKMMVNIARDGITGLTKKQPPVE